MKSLLLLLFLFPPMTHAELSLQMRQRIDELLKIGYVKGGHECFETALYVSGYHDHFINRPRDIELLVEPQCRKLDTTIAGAPNGSLVLIPTRHAFIKINDSESFEKDGAWGERSPFRIKNTSEILKEYEVGDSDLLIYDCTSNPFKRWPLPHQAQGYLDALDRISKQSRYGLNLEAFQELEKIFTSPVSEDLREFIAKAPEWQVTTVVTAARDTLMLGFYGSPRELAKWNHLVEKAEPFFLKLIHYQLQRSDISASGLGSLAKTMAYIPNTPKTDYQLYLGHINKLRTQGVATAQLDDLIRNGLRHPNFLIPDKTPYILDYAKVTTRNHIAVHVAVKNPSPMDWPLIRQYMLDAYKASGYEVDDPFIVFLWFPQQSEEFMSRPYLSKLLELAPEGIRAKLRAEIVAKQLKMLSLFRDALSEEQSKPHGRDASLIEDLSRKIKLLKELSHDFGS